MNIDTFKGINASLNKNGVRMRGEVSCNVRDTPAEWQVPTWLQFWKVLCGKLHEWINISQKMKH